MPVLGNTIADFVEKGKRPLPGGRSREKRDAGKRGADDGQVDKSDCALLDREDVCTGSLRTQENARLYRRAFSLLEGCFEEGRTYSIKWKGSVRLRPVPEYVFIIVFICGFCVN